MAVHRARKGMPEDGCISIRSNALGVVVALSHSTGAASASVASSRRRLLRRGISEELHAWIRNMHFFKRRQMSVQYTLARVSDEAPSAECCLPLLNLGLLLCARCTSPHQTKENIMRPRLKALVRPAANSPRRTIAAREHMWPAPLAGPCTENSDSPAFVLGRPSICLSLSRTFQVSFITPRGIGFLTKAHQSRAEKAGGRGELTPYSLLPRVFDGHRYEGQMSNGQAKGKGTWYYARGDRHVGKWLDHKPHGEGQ